MTRLLTVILTLILFSCNNNNNSKVTIPITKPVENITPTKDQQERRHNSESYCKAHNIPIYANPNSLFVDPEDKVTIRTQDEVVDRALALYYIGLKSEGLEQKHLDKMDKDFNIMPKLSPTRKELIQLPNNQPNNKKLMPIGDMKAYTLCCGH